MEAITRSIQRDEYIMAQALYRAIEAMEKVEPDYFREPSNIADMRLILETRYPHYIGIFTVEDEQRAKHLAELKTRG